MQRGQTLAILIVGVSLAALLVSPVVLGTVGIGGAVAVCWVEQTRTDWQLSQHLKRDLGTRPALSWHASDGFYRSGERDVSVALRAPGPPPPGVSEFIRYTEADGTVHLSTRDWPCDIDAQSCRPRSVTDAFAAHSGPGVVVWNRSKPWACGED